MRIAIDYTAAIRQDAGIGTSLRHLVDAALAQDTTNRYTLLSSAAPSVRHPFPTAKNVRGQHIPIPDRYLNVLWYRWRVPLRATLFAGATDIYHGPDFVLPPLSRRMRTVVTIHDLAFLEHPEYVEPSLAAYLRRVVPDAIATADVVVTVSRAVQQSIITQYRTPPEKLVVIPNGISPWLHRISDPILLNATRYKFGLKSPFVLTVGRREPRKNHAGLIKAFYQAQKRKQGPAMLVIAGGEGWCNDETQRLIEEFKLSKKVRLLGRVSDLELAHLYSMADVFAFPSFSEGFGMPPLEAMACGVPVITSNTPALTEIVGDAALTVDPQQIEALAQAITRVLEQESMREELRQKGYQRARGYSWQASAQRLLDVYQRLYNGEKVYINSTEQGDHIS